jgi:hypothetical protein
MNSHPDSLKVIVPSLKTHRCPLLHQPETVNQPQPTTKTNHATNRICIAPAECRLINLGKRSADEDIVGVTRCAWYCILFLADLHIDVPETFIGEKTTTKIRYSTIKKY